jgi:uncharacterized RDD family membrane protein YckC
MAPVSNPPPAPGPVYPQWQPPPRYQPPPPALAPNGQPLASFADRFLAYLIDTLIYVGISLVWTVPFMIWWIVRLNEWMSDFMNTYGYDPNLPDAQPPPPDFGFFWDLYLPVIYFSLAVTVVGAVYTYLYWVEFQMRRGGQTVGKRVMKIRVIPVDPGVAAVARGGYALRWVIQYVVPILVPLFNLIDGLWQVWDKPLQQCLHDKAANTVVVKVG